MRSRMVRLRNSRLFWRPESGPWMHSLRDFGLLAALVVVLGWTGVARGEKSGKEIFLEQKCNKCHAIQSEKIAKLEKKGGEEDELAGEEETEQVEPPDLSGAGKTRDAEWLAKWLQKQVKDEKGRKHRGKFKASDAELKTLTAYVAGLKAKGSPGGK